MEETQVHASLCFDLSGQRWSRWFSFRKNEELEASFPTRREDLGHTGKASVGLERLQLCKEQ